VNVSCAHRLYRESLTEEENQRLYGKCTNMHGHNYTISVTWTGEIDANGMVLDLAVAKKHIDDKVVAAIDHKCLEVLDYFREKPSTTENLCLFIASLLEPSIGTARLTQISVQETENNIFTLQLGSQE
jgi:6-pyruvoyltetrahydropterin/6-carboxytetrahydropterin synthase